MTKFRTTTHLPGESPVSAWGGIPGWSPADALGQAAEAQAAEATGAAASRPGRGLRYTDRPGLTVGIVLVTVLVVGLLLPGGGLVLSLIYAVTILRGTSVRWLFVLLGALMLAGALLTLGTVGVVEGGSTSTTPTEGP